MRVSLHAAAEHGAVEDVERREQGRGAMALVVMGHGSAFAGLERQAGLGAVEGLDLRLLVDRQHDGMGRRVHVEADDVLDLVGEGGIIGALEGPDAVRLEAVSLPDPLHRAQAQAHGLGHRPAGPVSGRARRLGAGQREHLGHHRCRHGRLAGRAGLVAQQSPSTPSSA